MAVRTILFLANTRKLWGAERSLLELVIRLDPRQFFPVVIIPEAAGPEVALFFKAVKVERVVMPRIRRALEPRALLGQWSGIRTFRKELVELLDRYQPALLYSNGIRSQVLLHSRKHIGGIPVVYHCRDFPKYQWLERRAMKRASKTVVASEFMAAALERLAGNVHVIPNPVENKLLAAKTDPLYDRQPVVTPPVLLQLGQLIPWKRHALSIKIMAALQSRGFPCQLWIAGHRPEDEHGAYFNALQALVRQLRLEEAVRFIPFQDTPRDLFRQAALLLHPADREPFGRVVVESLLAAVPVLACEGSGAAEIVRASQGGRVIPAGPDEVAIRDGADRVMALLGRPDVYRAMVQSGYRWANRECNPDLICRKWEALFSELCGAP